MEARLPTCQRLVSKWGWPYPLPLTTVPPPKASSPTPAINTLRGVGTTGVPATCRDNTQRELVVLPGQD